MDLFKCSNCGFEVLKSANFCSNCGAALKDPMPEIEYFNKAQSQEVSNLDEESNLNKEVSVENDVENNEITSVEEERPRRILWMPEWAFYTGLLLSGIMAILVYKFMSDPTWSSWCNFSLGQDYDTISQIDGLNESTNLSIDIVDSVYEDSVFTPMMNALDVDTISKKISSTDSAYHVVIMTLKDLAQAEKIKDKNKENFDSIYIISDSTLHRVAVYSSPTKEEAQHHMNTVVQKKCSGVWVFYGPAK